MDRAGVPQAAGQDAAGPEKSTPTGISPDVLLRQVQILLNAADEANDSGRYETFALQRQAREVLAEAIDRLSIQPNAPLVLAGDERALRRVFYCAVSRGVAVSPYERDEMENAFICAVKRRANALRKEARHA